MKIKEIVGLAISIIDNRKDLGKYTYWETYVGSPQDEFELTKMGIKPMMLLWESNPDAQVYINKAKNICDKDLGFSCGYIGQSDIHFIFGEPTYVHIGEILPKIVDYVDDDQFMYDVMLGLLLGYPIPNIASFLNRLTIMGSDFDLNIVSSTPKRSRNPIKDVLLGKKDLVQISYPTRKHADKEIINERINELTEIINEKSHLDYCVCYRNNNYGTPYIVFGDKRLVDAYWEQIP